MGKTLAVAVGPMLQALTEQSSGGASARSRRATGAGPREHESRTRDVRQGLRLIWLTPLRALAADTAHALSDAAQGLGLSWRVELRTGDTSSAIKARQRAGLPEVLVTTPESLSVLLSYADLASPDGPLSSVRCAIVDEWHELMGSKRGVMTELVLARLRTLTRHARAGASMQTWGCSATLGNLEQARDVLLGAGPPSSADDRVIVRGRGDRDGARAAGDQDPGDKQYELTTILPPDIERFPWAGHLGIRLLPQVIEAIDRARTTLLFTNTRSQSEIWFASLLQAREDMMGRIAIHHGSLDRKLRAKVEAAIDSGALACCVCTSSLDLGVDFAPVDQVIQIGSPKGLGRFIQRAGRSGHRPGAISKVVCVPTNALELLEFAAARDALQPEISGAALATIEPRVPISLAMDVLVQHMLTLAVGAGFDADALGDEVRTTAAFAGLTDAQWQWAMEYVQRGGPALGAYDRYKRVTRDEATGLYRCASQLLSRAHRLNIGTITSDTSIAVKFQRGRTLGSVEEGFIAKLKPGDVFAFSGRLLQLVRVQQMTATVRPAPARRSKGQVPSWQGTRMPLSSHLAGAMRLRLAEAARGEFRGPEMQAVAPIVRVQQAWSSLPLPGVLVIELIDLPDGHHAFVYPLAGRLVHEGLAALVAWRLARAEPRSFTLASGDLGFHLHATSPMPADEVTWRAVLSDANLGADVVASMNAAQLARRQFREVARIAGLMQQGFPGEKRSARQTQASSELFFDVFAQFDPGNLLLDQAQREVLERQLELTRMAGTLAELRMHRLVITRPDRLTPLAFPLWVDSLREQLSSEKWADRVQKMLAQLEGDAGMVR